MTPTSKTLFTAAALAAGLSITGISAAQASTVTVITQTGTPMETVHGIRPDTGTRGVDVAGSIVTATFADGSTETATWMAFDSFTLGGANGDRWSLFQGDTDATNLISDGRIMTSLTIDMSTSQSNTLSNDVVPVPVSHGASVFDIRPLEDGSVPETEASTPGSSFGFPFEWTFNAPTGSIEVTYSGVVNIAGQAAVGDLYTTMHIDFSGLDLGGFTGDSVFRTDRDTLLVAGDLVPAMAPVPLPAGLPLLALALGALGIARRRK